MNASRPDRSPVWPGGPALWLWAAPAIVTCGNFSVLIATLFARPEWLEELDAVWQALGAGWFADAVIFGGVSAPSAFPGAAYLLRRKGPTSAGWRDAGRYAAIAWPAATAGAIGMIWIVRSFAFLVD